MLFYGRILKICIASAYPELRDNDIMIYVYGTEKKAQMLTRS